MSLAFRKKNRSANKDALPVRRSCLCGFDCMAQGNPSSGQVRSAKPGFHPKDEAMPPDGEASENSSVSPGCVCVWRIVPDGSSSIE